MKNIGTSPRKTYWPSSSFEQRANSHENLLFIVM